MVPDHAILFLDLDGVLADFDGHYKALFGEDPRDIPDEVMWPKINANRSYFADMPPAPGAIEFFHSVAHYHPIILTACPKSDYANVARQKRGWVRQHLSRRAIVMPVMGGINKPLFMHAPGDILVDDYRRNIDAWVSERGIGILHRNFADTVIQLAAVLPSQVPA